MTPRECLALPPRSVFGRASAGPNKCHLEKRDQSSTPTPLPSSRPPLNDAFPLAPSPARSPAGDGRRARGIPLGQHSPGLLPWPEKWGRREPPRRARPGPRPRLQPRGAPPPPPGPRGATRPPSTPRSEVPLGPDGSRSPPLSRAPPCPALPPQFVIRLAEALKKKPTLDDVKKASSELHKGPAAAAGGGAGGGGGGTPGGERRPPAFNPFLPYDENLYVRHLARAGGGLPPRRAAPGPRRSLPLRCHAPSARLWVLTPLTIPTTPRSRRSTSSS